MASTIGATPISTSPAEPSPEAAGPDASSSRWTLTASAAAATSLSGRPRTTAPAPLPNPAALRCSVPGSSVLADCCEGASLDDAGATRWDAFRPGEGQLRGEVAPHSQPKT